MQLAETEPERALAQLTELRQEVHSQLEGYEGIDAWHEGQADGLILSVIYHELRDYKRAKPLLLRNVEQSRNRIRMEQWRLALNVEEAADCCLQLGELQTASKLAAEALDLLRDHPDAAIEKRLKTIVKACAAKPKRKKRLPDS
jgi:hypothetical protein